MPDTLESLREVSVAILSCNRREELRETLARLRDERAPWREIVVADNASSDGTPEMVAACFPEARLIALEENRGVAGLNAAMGACSGAWILSLDDDSCPVIDSWGGLDAALREGIGYDAVTCSVRAKGERGGSTDGRPGIDDYLGLHQAGSLVRRELVEALGGYDESLFLWGVELDFAARALGRGARLGKLDAAVVEHRCAPANRSSRRHAYYYTRNLLVFLKRHAPASERRRLMKGFLANAVLFSALHRTSVYWRAARASRAWRVGGAGLTTEQFERMGPDLRLPFSFLG